MIRTGFGGYTMYHENQELYGRIVEIPQAAQAAFRGLEIHWAFGMLRAA